MTEIGLDSITGAEPLPKKYESKFRELEVVIQGYLKAYSGVSPALLGGAFLMFEQRESTLEIKLLGMPDSDQDPNQGYEVRYTSMNANLNGMADSNTKVLNPNVNPDAINSGALTSAELALETLHSEDNRFLGLWLRRLPDKPGQ